jgi:hypothetical protein
MQLESQLSRNEPRLKITVADRESNFLKLFIIIINFIIIIIIIIIIFGRGLGGNKIVACLKFQIWLFHRTQLILRLLLIMAVIAVVVVVVVVVIAVTLSVGHR